MDKIIGKTITEAFLEEDNYEDENGDVVWQTKLVIRTTDNKQLVVYIDPKDKPRIFSL